MSGVIPSRITVVIAEDHAVVAEGIALVLRPAFCVVGEVRRLIDLIPVLLERRPMVAVLDVAFEGESSIPVMRRAKQDHGVPTRFVILTAHESRSLAQAAFANGAHAFVAKGSSGLDLRLAIVAAAEGRRFISSRVASLPEEPSEPAGRRQRITLGGVSLTRRQHEVLAMIASGMPRVEIASSLGITVKGVEYNVAIVRRITGITRLLDLVRWFDHESQSRSAVDALLPRA